jgi:formylglycine-generating enzyme required for sulfatase activity
MSPDRISLETTMRICLALAALSAVPLLAQARSTILVGPAALGATCYVRHQLPSGTIGNIAAFLWSTPFAGAVPVSLPGFTVNGLLRVDPLASQLLGATVTNGSDLPTMPLSVPATTTLLGGQLDCQSFDLDATATLRLAANDVTLTIVPGPDAGLNLQTIQPGTFVMGSAAGDPDELPLRTVTISRPFWMGRYEVTQDQYQAVMGSNPSFFLGAGVPGGGQLPVETVTWNQAMAYCAALTASEQAAGRVPAGYQYRLPTEAEWEYCCRAGTTTEWNTGTSLSTSQANFAGVFQDFEDNVNGRTIPVGFYAPNAFGLFDMHGNVEEWCLDRYGPFAAGAAVDPFANTGLGRILRGGYWHWGVDAAYCRSASRNFSDATTAQAYGGFRVVLAPGIVP